MNALEYLVTEENGWRYIHRLAHEGDNDAKVAIAALLKKEEDKFANAAELFDAAASWIRKCDAHIARGRTLMEKHAANGDGAFSRLETTVRTMNEIKLTLLSLQQTIGQHLESTTEFLQRPSA